MRQPILLQDFLEQSAEQFPDKAALIHGGRRVTYAQLTALTDGLANALAAQGVARGDRVAVFMDNCIEAVVALFAALKTGAAFLIINHTVKREKLEYFLRDCGAAGLITQSSRRSIVQDLGCPHLKAIIVSGRDRDDLGSLDFDECTSSVCSRKSRTASIDLDLASIIYTSGSTGRPKGVMLSHRNMTAAARSITTYLENTHRDIILNALPLSFDYGLYQILMAFLVGATVVLEKSFAYPASVLGTMAREHVTGFPAVPTMFSILLRTNDLACADLHDLRYITSTAARLPVQHVEKLRQLLPHVRIYSMYGLTECKRVSYLSPDELDARPTSVGKAMPNEEVYLVDESGQKTAPGRVGELVVRGGNVMLGYWNLPEESKRRLRPGPYPGERVLYTGDLFTMDEDGFLYFVGRSDDIIKCGGKKISPEEIENVLCSHDLILEAAVIGVPDDVLGAAIKAYVVRVPGARLSPRDVLRYCSEKLENGLVPKYVEMRDELPRTSSGKIDKRCLNPTFACS